MQNDIDISKEYLASIGDELDRITRHHKSAKSALLRLIDAFGKVDVDNRWVIVKAILDVTNLLDNNLESLDKLQFKLTLAKGSLNLQIFLQFLLGHQVKVSRMDSFSRLLEKAITNLEKAFNELKTLFLPFFSPNVTALVMVLKDPLDDIESAHKSARNTMELLSKISTVSHEEETNLMSGLEKKIYEGLLRAVPSAALAYKQAVVDLADKNRVSYRGVAGEFRESLREILDYLAPDNDLKSQPNFKLENGRTTPTMKQKARYALRARGVIGNATKAPEESIEIIEERISSFARATYERSSISAHIASERDEVQQIKLYTNAILTELLQVQF